MDASAFLFLASCEATKIAKGWGKAGRIKKNRTDRARRYGKRDEYYHASPNRLRKGDVLEAQDEGNWGVQEENVFFTSSPVPWEGHRNPYR